MRRNAERCRKTLLKIGFYRSQVTSLLWASQGYVKRQRDILCSVKKAAVKEWPYFLIWRKSLQAHSSPIPSYCQLQLLQLLGQVWEEGKTSADSNLPLWVPVCPCSPHFTSCLPVLWTLALVSDTGTTASHRQCCQLLELRTVKSPIINPLLH